MRKLALSLLLVSGVAYADSTVTLTYEAKDNPKAVTAMKAEAEKHLAEFEKASNGKKFSVIFTLKKLEQAKDATKCNISIAVGAPGNSLAGVITGGAGTQGITETSAADCISGTVESLTKKIVQLIETKAK